MGFKLYNKLAVQNIKKNKSTYLPYIFSSIVIIALFYILVSIKISTDASAFMGDNTMEILLNLGINVTGLFSLVFLFYTNGFLMKRRQKELGLYSVLGMEKRHINKVITLEIIYSALISLGLGLFLGLVFSKLMFAMLLNLLHLDTSIRMILSIEPVTKTTLTYGGVFLLVIAYNAVLIARMKPLDLVRSKEKGEKEPNANCFVGLLGLVSLLTGYTISLRLENPILALPSLFVAIVFVAIGTYLLFTSGSILVLKFLRKRKNIYYQKNNFITISNLICRMKQNAVGLANITILSTAVLLVLSTTFSLYIGMEDILKNDPPREVITKFVSDPELSSVVNTAIEKQADKYNLQIKDILDFDNLTAMIYQEGDVITSANMVENENLFKMKYLEVYTVEDYNRIYLEELKLNRNEIAIYSDSIELNYAKLNIMDEEYSVKEVLSDKVFYPEEAVPSLTVVVSSLDELKALKVRSQILLNEEGSYYSSNITRNYYFDIEGNVEDKLEFVATLREVIREEREETGLVRDIYNRKGEYLSLYGSLFFVGAFLGTLFLVATILIIYFKQISEGYQDQERFEIFQKVGMTKDEVKSTINTQIKFVFFLPVVVASIHIAFAFPLLKKMLAILGLLNTNLFIMVTVITIAVFALVYSVIYHQTAKVYYRIVN